MAKRKWDFLREKYSKLPPEAGQNEKVEAVLNSEAPAEYQDPLRLEELGPEKVRDLDNERLHKMYLWKRDMLDEVTAMAKMLSLEVEALTREWVERMEEDGLASVEFTDGVAFGASVEPYCSVEDQPAMLAWVREEGLESMLTLNWQTLSSIVKERLEGKVDKPLPPGVKVFLKDKLSCRGRNKAQTTTASNSV